MKDEEELIKNVTIVTTVLAGLGKLLSLFVRKKEDIPLQVTDKDGNVEEKFQILKSRVERLETEMQSTVRKPELDRFIDSIHREMESHKSFTLTLHQENRDINKATNDKQDRMDSKLDRITSILLEKSLEKSLK